MDAVPFRERGRPYYIFSAFKYDEQNRRWHPLRTSGLPLGLLQSPLEHDKWFISVSPSPLIPVVGVRATRMERTRVQRCSESHFRDTHVPVQTRGYGYVWALSGESARWLPAVAGRAPIRRGFVQQPLPFSTSTRFVNTVLWLSFLNTRLYARAPCPWNIVQTERLGSDGSWFIDTYTWICSENGLNRVENNFIVKTTRLCATSSMEWKG